MSDNTIYLLVALGLSGLAVFCYFFLKNKNKSTVKAQNNTIQDKAIADEIEAITDFQEPILRAKMELEELERIKAMTGKERLEKLAELARKN